MIPSFSSKTMRFLSLLVGAILVSASLFAQTDMQLELSPDKVNLALRRTADGLLRLSGDSTSRIPAIEQTGPGVWRVRLERPFRYEQLPGLLQSSLDLFEIKQPYDVAVRRCEDAIIDLGYHQQDFLQTKSVACQGRDLDESCHFIEISFLKQHAKKPFWAGINGLLILILSGVAGFWIFRRQKSVSLPPLADDEKDWLEFGNSRLDVSGQQLIHGDERQALTFRETKLLKLFVTSPDQLLERDFILREVWADEGVLVGRSVDVFVSRLRKKLAVDLTVGIVAVHGVGYRLETGK